MNSGGQRLTYTACAGTGHTPFLIASEDGHDVHLIFLRVLEVDSGSPLFTGKKLCRKRVEESATILSDSLEHYSATFLQLLIQQESSRQRRSYRTSNHSKLYPSMLFRTAHCTQPSCGGMSMLTRSLHDKRANSDNLNQPLPL